MSQTVITEEQENMSYDEAREYLSSLNSRCNVNLEECHEYSILQLYSPHINVFTSKTKGVFPWNLDKGTIIPVYEPKCMTFCDVPVLGWPLMSLIKADEYRNGLCWTELVEFWDRETSTESRHLTLKVLNFWKFTSYSSLKPLWLGMGK